MNLPKAFIEKMQTLLGEDYDNYINSFAQTYGQSFRVNQLKTEPAEILRRFAVHPVPWCTSGFYFEGQERLSLHPYYYGGAFYLQEPSAMAPASFLPVRPGDKVLDLCAAPGGKTTALASKLQGEGVLIANDISISRCKALLKNIELAGVKNAMITCASPDKLAEVFPNYFDCILADAPCSGEGMFRKMPSMAGDWSLDEVERYSGLQKEIISQAARMLKPGGYLLYSTCTYSPEENEQVVETLLKKKDSQGQSFFTMEEITLSAGETPNAEGILGQEKFGVDAGHPEWSRSKNESLRHCRRFWNHRVQGEGQFAALLKKNMEGQADVRKDTDSIGRGKKSDIPKEMQVFLSECAINFPVEQIQFIKERAFFLPKGLPEMNSLRIVRSGLYLGDCKKKRFEPSQALAMALRPREYARSLSLPLGDTRVEKYLRCETIEAETDDGWVLVCVDDLPLGWGKASRGIIKNKYAPGWRKQ